MRKVHPCARGGAPRLCVAAVLGCVLGGCAHGAPEAELGELRTRLTDSQRKEADARRRIDELENRVFLMSDQLESQKVAHAAARAPRLPVVTLRPEEEPRRDAEPGDFSRSEEDVELVGAARSSDARHVRPVLRGDGDLAPEPRPRVSRARASDEVRPTGGAPDSLGVAPAPPIPKGAPELGLADLPPVKEEPLRAYRAAYGELTAGRYDEAEQKLRAFVRRYPRHDYADNAQYWLAESFYARHRYQDAAVEFRAVVARYPVGNKAPDAMLKLAYSLLALGQAGEARRLLEELPATYPRSEAARLATQKLADLGHGPRAALPTEDPR